MTNWLTLDEISSMRATVLNTQLDHVCTIKRKVESGRDSLNRPIVTLQTLYSNEPCHYWEESENEMVGTQNVTITREHVVTRADIDAITGDVVSAVVLYDTLEVGPFDILEVHRRVNHTDLIVRTAR